MNLARSLVLLWCFIGLSRGTPLLLFANRKDLRLVDAGNPKGNSTILVSDLEDGAAVDFIYEDNMVFWTDVTLELIKRTWINDSQVTQDVISTGLVSPDGLAVDWLGRKLYWTDSETKRIEVSNLDGTYRKVLFWQSLFQPRAIALDPLNGYMYWTDWGDIPKIEKAGMDGSRGSRSIVIDKDIFWPNGLTLDYDSSKIFWVDAKLHFIHSCDFDGSNRNKVVEGELPHPFALTVYKESLYWTDWQTQSIHRCNKVTGGDRHRVHDNILSPMDIHAYSKDRQPTGTNPCERRNGGCSHLCLMSPYRPFYSCACPTGVQLQSDNKTCAEVPRHILLLARRTDIRRISLDTPDYTDVVLQLEDIKHAIAIDYDPVGEYVYWTDDEARTIRRTYLDGTGQETLVSTDVHHPDGIAVDWVARNLYWTDTGTDRIEVSRLNGTSRRVLVSEDLDQPRAIALDPVAGHMYWTDWGKPPKIERANLDGTDRVTLISHSLGWPNGLTLDFVERKMYWGDADTHTIEVANMDGTRRKVLVDTELPHIFGFSLLGDFLYWTDWQLRNIERVDKRTGKNRSIIIEQLPDLMGLKAVDVKKLEGTNPCATDNGGCTHLCLYRANPRGHVCVCPMGHELMSNGRTCIIPEAFLLFTRRVDIRRISLEYNHNNMVIPLGGIEEAAALDFDINDNRIYWTDTSVKSISRAFMNGSALEHVVDFGLDYPEGMAVDWVAHNMYWADTGRRRIEMSRLDGTSRKVLVWKNGTSPRSIALDPPSGLMYWSDWSVPPRIVRTKLDGTEPKVIVSNSGRANSLTIDYTDRRLYWTNQDTHRIESVNLDGTNRQRVLSEDLPQPVSITLYDDFIYWTDWETQTIERANKTNGQNRTKIQGDMQYIMDLLVFHQSRQSGSNPCGITNSGCSHLCIAHGQQHPGDPGYHCGCPTHYTLENDTKTCLPPRSFLLYSRRSDVSRMVVSQQDSPDMVLALHSLHRLRAIDYDPIKQHVYWIDGRTRAIKRALENGTKSTTVMNPPASVQFSPFDIAIDPYSRTLYWSDTRKDVINVTRLDGRGVGVVVDGPGQKPYYIALAPTKGYMFWSNMVSPNKIERADMDGTSRVTLFDNNIRELGALCADEKSEKVFWTDMELRRIESADFDGGNRRVLAEGQIQMPIGIAAFDDYVYWIDKEKNAIERVSKYAARDRVHVQSRVTQLSDIVAAEEITSKQYAAHPCHGDNGCSHLCVALRGSKRRCSCPIGLVLTNDDKTCAEPPTCAADEFTCDSGLCIPEKWRCDGLSECDDDSDEKSCPQCLSSQFQCNNGKCIALDRLCDGLPDCTDKSDESNCPPCKNNEFRCEHTLFCVKEHLVCNEQQNCPDGSDEKYCFRNGIPESRTGTEATRNTIVVVVGLVVLLVFLGVVLIMCKRQRPYLINDDSREFVMMTKPLNPAVPPQYMPPHTASSRDKSGTTCMTLSSAKPSCGPPPLYDRNHVTGASSSTSTVTQYPQETLNPPPSPVTDRSVQGGSYYTTNSPSTTLHSHRQYKRRNIPPPPPGPTPCSTDVCEDSEATFSNVGGKYYRHLDDLNYDSDVVYPPPPTPRSQYFSDIEPSCPPSPSTERSFFNPYPPPPSPVGPLSDC